MRSSFIPTLKGNREREILLLIPYAILQPTPHLGNVPWLPPFMPARDNPRLLTAQMHCIPTWLTLTPTCPAPQAGQLVLNHQVLDKLAQSTVPLRVGLGEGEGVDNWKDWGGRRRKLISRPLCPAKQADLRRGKAVLSY